MKSLPSSQVCVLFVTGHVFLIQIQTLILQGPQPRSSELTRARSKSDCIELSTGSELQVLKITSKCVKEELSC